MQITTNLPAYSLKIDTFQPGLRTVNPSPTQQVGSSAGCKVFVLSLWQEHKRVALDETRKRQFVIASIGSAVSLKGKGQNQHAVAIMP